MATPTDGQSFAPAPTAPPLPSVEVATRFATPYAILPSTGRITVGSGAATVGLDVVVTVTLNAVETSGQTGYAFILAWDAERLAMKPAPETSDGCTGGKGGVLPKPGANPYIAACVNLPGPGTADTECGVKACVVATITFTCIAPGTAALDLSSDSAAIADSGGKERRLAVENGAITCTEAATSATG